LQTQIVRFRDFLWKIHLKLADVFERETAQDTAEAGTEMPDYIYLLENRLSADQRNALRHLREVAREAGTILFLTGDAVRDLTSGHAVRALEVVVHGNALKLKKAIEKLGGKVWGEDEASLSLYLCFPGTVRVDLLSAHSVEYLKPGNPVYHSASIQEDLRRRDFTINAMAISLNEGSFGLLMDPLNGVADIETRTLRLVSNYGFLEEPSLLIRASRYRARLGWEFDPKSQTRYENAVSDGVIEHLSDQARSQELEQIGHEEEGLKVLGALDADGWMKVLFPAWTPAKADEEKLTALHDLAVELLLQGVHADMSAAQMQLLTAKMAPKELAALKKLMLRPGFLEEWNSLDALAAGFAKVLLAKENATPSVSYKLFTTYDPEAILWLGFTTKDAVVKERFNLFLKVWPEARQKIPHALMQEMRITPELAIYAEVVHSIFLELIDGKLTTAEEQRAFLEPHSPPAPPPKEVIKRPRAKRTEKLKESFDDESDEDADEDGDLDDIGGDDDEIGLGLHLPKSALDTEAHDEAEDDLEDEEESKPTPAPVKSGAKATPAPAAAKPTAEKAVKPVPAAKSKPEPKPVPVAAAKPALKPAAKTAAPAPAASKAVTKSIPPAKPAAKTSAKAPAKVVKPVAKAPVKAAVKTPVKAPAKPAVKASAKPAAKAPAPKSAPAKGKPVAPAKAKKTAKPVDRKSHKDKKKKKH
jgi:tRNA nucleotidyltransferase/poly(A) polymerase